MVKLMARDWYKSWDVGENYRECTKQKSKSLECSEEKWFMLVREAVSEVIDRLDPDNYRYSKRKDDLDCLHQLRGIRTNNTMFHIWRDDPALGDNTVEDIEVQHKNGARYRRQQRCMKRKRKN